MPHTRTLLCLATTATLGLSGCEKEPTEGVAKVLAAETEPSQAPARPSGLHPDDFECESVASGAAVGAALEREIIVETSSFEAPQGVPRACNYTARGAGFDEATKDAGPAAAQPTWSFDIDCRRTALRDGAALMTQYAKNLDSKPLQIGKSAIDHRDVVLLLIDDDTPCYARVLGPGSANRIAIATIVAAGLKPETAPALRSASR